jgi:hypothetical protein
LKITNLNESSNGKQKRIEKKKLSRNLMAHFFSFFCSGGIGILNSGPQAC